MSADSAERREPQTPLKAALPELDAGMTVSDAFAAIARSELEHLRGNEQGVLDGNDPEFLHQMRVALRRLRSALSAFSSALPQAAREPVAKDLKWLGGALGPARDWDVFMTETLPGMREALGARAGLDTLTAECERLRSEAQRRTRRTIRSPRYHRVVTATASWLSLQDWRVHADGDSAARLDAPIRGFAQAELERRYERVRKRGRKLGQLTGDELHKLRIAVKKMRYSIDFFASLFEGEAVGALRSRLSRLQDVLGTINDAATSGRLAEGALGDTRAAAAAEARGILLGWGAGSADALRGELDRRWKAFRRSETFW